MNSVDVLQNSFGSIKQVPDNYSSPFSSPNTNPTTFYNNNNQYQQQQQQHNNYIGNSSRNISSNLISPSVNTSNNTSSNSYNNNNSNNKNHAPFPTTTVHGGGGGATALRNNNSHDHGGLYSNSNRNLITQKFAPVGIIPSSSNNKYHYTSNNSNSSNSNNSQSFGANNSPNNNNNNHDNIGTGRTTSFNSHLNSESYTTTPNSNNVGNNNGNNNIGINKNNTNSNNTAAAGIPTSNSQNVSPITNGGYQIKNSAADLNYPHHATSNAKSEQQQRSEALNSHWNKTCLYNTGSTLESLQANTARDSLNKSNWGLSRDEIKQKLVNSLTSDRNIAILPGFQSNSNSNGERRIPHTLSSPSINYARQEQDKVERVSSPVSRAQIAIGQSRRELGQVQSMMEMNNNINGRNRHVRGRQWLGMDTDSLLMKRSKQQSYRQELERQIEQSRFRKNEMRRLDFEGDHPLGVKYNSPIPQNYLDECLQPPKQVPSNPASMARDYSKYLELMAKREILVEERQQRQPQAIRQAPRQQIPNPQHQSGNLNTNQNPNPYNNQPQELSPRINPQLQQQQQMQYAQAQQYYHPYYGAYPCYGYPPQPDAFNQCAVAPQAQPNQQFPSNPFPAQSFQQFPYQESNPQQNVHPKPHSVSPQPQRPLSPQMQDSMHDMENFPVQGIPNGTSLPSGNRETSNKIHVEEQNLSEFSDDSKQNLEQSILRLHVWQESDQMPNHELKTILYKRDLMKQIRHKRKEEMDRRAKEAEEDERIEKKILDYQAKMKREIEEEREQLCRMNGIKIRKHDPNHHHNHLLRDPNFHKHHHHHHNQHLNYKHHNVQRKYDPSSPAFSNIHKINHEETEEGVEVDDIKNAERSDSVDSNISEFSLDNTESLISTNTFPEPQALNRIALPTLVHNKKNLSARSNEGSKSVINPSEPRKILQDLKVLSNVHKILKKEAKRVDRFLHEKQNGSGRRVK